METVMLISTHLNFMNPLKSPEKPLHYSDSNPKGGEVLEASEVEGA